MNKERKIDPKIDKVAMPVSMIPQFRTEIAIQNGVEKNLLLRTWGGLGDQICAEPTLRYGLKYFSNCDVSLESEVPQLFSHLKFKNVFDVKNKSVDYDKYFCFETITPPNDSNLVWQFFSHMITNCVDFPSLCAFRFQLPIEDKEILLTPSIPMDSEIANLIDDPMNVFVHAGRHWTSKTFPKDWWDDVLTAMIEKGMTPVLIGANTDDNRGTVDVETLGCIDLRNRTSITDCAWLLQRARVLITNDSSPMHMAASRNPNDPKTGLTHIGYIATCKHPDYITHWRRPHGEGRPEFQWRETNLGLGGMWDIYSNCPNNSEEVTVEHIDEKILRTWLPTPQSVVGWATEKLW